MNRAEEVGLTTLLLASIRAGLIGSGRMQLVSCKWLRLPADHLEDSFELSLGSLGKDLVAYGPCILQLSLCFHLSLRSPHSGGGSAGS